MLTPPFADDIADESDGEEDGEAIMGDCGEPSASSSARRLTRDEMLAQLPATNMDTQAFQELGPALVAAIRSPEPDV